MKKKQKGLILSKNCLWLVALLTSLFVAMAFNSRSSWFLFYFLAVMFGLSMLSLISSLRRLTGLLEETIRLNQGTTGKLKVLVRHQKGRLFSLSQLRATLYFAHYQLPLRSSKSFQVLERQLTLAGHLSDKLTRGYYQKLKLSLRVTDVFGLFSKEHAILLAQSLVILPEVRSVQALELAKELQRRDFFLPHELLKDYDVEALRFYREGDQLSQVDWKLSAKKNELIVKEFTDEREKKATLVFYGNDGRHFEQLLAIFYSFEQQFLASKSPLTPLIYHPKDGLVPPSKEHYCQIQPVENEETALATMLTKLPRKQPLIILVPHFSNKMKEFSLQLSHQQSLLLVTLDQKSHLLYLKPGQWSERGGA